MLIFWGVLSRKRAYNCGICRGDADHANIIILDSWGDSCEDQVAINGGQYMGQGYLPPQSFSGTLMFIV